MRRALLATALLACPLLMGTSPAFARSVALTTTADGEAAAMTPLAMATISACTAFGAVCGSSPATAATMATVAIPEMKRFGYRPEQPGIKRRPEKRVGA